MTEGLREQDLVLAAILVNLGLGSNSCLASRDGRDEGGSEREKGSSLVEHVGSVV